jgi:septal ring factor EnvC (AmiA/AmiB activator)
MEFVYLIIAFIIMVCIATYAISKMQPKPNEALLKILIKKDAEIAELNRKLDMQKEIEKLLDGEVLRLNETIHEMRVRIIEIKNILEPKSDKIILCDERGELHG